MNHSDIEHMAQGYPPSHIGKDCEEVITWLATQLLATQEQRNAMAAESVALKSAISYVCDTDNQPDYQYDGIGCGIEDRGIIDRYEAARYGWDEALERMYSEAIPCASDIETPATDAYLNTVRAEGVEALTKILQVMIDASDFDGDEVGAITGAIDAGNYHAAQLRAGEPS